MSGTASSIMTADSRFKVQGGYVHTITQLYDWYSRYYIIFIILELTHKDLVTYVAPHVTTKLREIGTALALTPPELDDIEENHEGVFGVFQLWYETEIRQYIWDTLLMILTI